MKCRTCGDVCPPLEIGMKWNCSCLSHPVRLALEALLKTIEELPEEVKSGLLNRYREIRGTQGETTNKAPTSFQNVEFFSTDKEADEAADFLLHWKKMILKNLSFTHPTYELIDEIKVTRPIWKSSKFFFQRGTITVVLYFAEKKLDKSIYLC